MSCEEMTVWVKLDERNDSIIVDCAPVVRKFMYGEFDRLLG